MVHPILKASKWLPELDNSAVAYVLVVVGIIGLVTEVTSTMAAGRIVLFAVALAAGMLGVVRRRRRFAVASLRERGRPA